MQFIWNNNNLPILQLSYYTSLVEHNNLHFQN